MRYLTQHTKELLGSAHRLVRQPGASALTVLVIAIALALPAGLRVLVNNTKLLAGSLQNAQDFSVYLTLETDESRARELAVELSQNLSVEQVTVVTRDEALAEFRTYSGLAGAVEALPENPLPHALVVRPRGGMESETDLEALSAELQALEETELVQLDTQWVERLRAGLEVARRTVDWATALLAIAILIVIGNTVRLEINNRQTEIEVTKLVGGTDGFIRRPFLYLGFWYGVAAGLVAWLLVTVGVATLSGPVARLAGLYGSGFGLQSLSGTESAVLVGGGALLGWLGAYVAATRHIRALDV